MDGVVHFEFPYDQPDRIAKFYESAFGWQTNKLGQEMNNYVLATTTEMDKDAPKRAGIINGGFFLRKKDWPAQHPTVVIAVENISDAITRVNQAGGKVMGEPMDIPNVGSYVSFIDTEGNRVAMLQPIPHNWHAPK